MTMTTNRDPRQFTVPCTITVRHTWETLEAHVDLAGQHKTEIGDKIIVHGEAVAVPFGQTTVIERMATVRRAGWLERQWTRFTAFFEITELYEVSFSSGSLR